MKRGISLGRTVLTLTTDTCAAHGEDALCVSGGAAVVNEKLAHWNIQEKIMLLNVERAIGSMIFLTPRALRYARHFLRGWRLAATDTARGLLAAREREKKGMESTERARARLYGDPNGSRTRRVYCGAGGAAGRRIRGCGLVGTCYDIGGGGGRPSTE